MSMLSRIVPAALAAATLIAACGGNVVVDPEGSGGTPTTTSTGPTTTPTTTTSTTNTTTPTPTTTQPSSCDNHGFCGDTESGCISCAVNDPCFPHLEACQTDQACIDYVTCVDPCPDQACADNCAENFPAGAQIYNDLVNCVICEQCYNDCDGAGSGCP
jgi:hypothetical protein